jgi:hypothetical protein
MFLRPWEVAMPWTDSSSPGSRTRWARRIARLRLPEFGAAAFGIAIAAAVYAPDKFTWG